MKREGVFCDFDQTRDFRDAASPCPEIAVGACISCNKDVCAKHGNANGISVSIRYSAEGGSPVELLSGACVLCEPCLHSVKKKQPALRDHLLPVMLMQLAESLRVTLAVEAMKK